MYVVGLFGMRSYCYVLFSLHKLHMDLGDASITFRILLKFGIAQQIFSLRLYLGVVISKWLSLSFVILHREPNPCKAQLDCK